LEKVEHSEGKGGEPSPVSIKDRIILTPMDKF
jgi:hypothetical protein